MIADTLERGAAAPPSSTGTATTHSGADAVMIARRNRDVARAKRRRPRPARLPRAGWGQRRSRSPAMTSRVGDRVMTRINTTQVSNRERWQVTAIDAESETIELQRIGGDGRSVSLGPDYLGRQTAGRRAGAAARLRDDHLRDRVKDLRAHLRAA